MTTSASSFFSSFQSKDKGYVEAFSDLCFFPGRYLTNGKTYVIEEATSLVGEERLGSDFDMKTWPWLKSAVAAFCLAITFFPGLIALGIARLIDPKMAERKEIVHQHLKLPRYSVNIPQPDESKDLKAYMNELYQLNCTLNLKIEELSKDASINHDAVKVWENPELVQLADQVMECMVRAARVLKANLVSDGRGKYEEMGNCKELFDLVVPYHWIRTCSYYKEHPYFKGRSDPHSGFLTRHGILNSDAERSYFELKTRQRKWRDYYNFVCDLFKNVSPHLNWMQKDVSKGTFKMPSGAHDALLGNLFAAKYFQLIKDGSKRLKIDDEHHRG